MQPNNLPDQDYNSLQQTVMIYPQVWHLHWLYVAVQHFGRLPYATCIMILKPKSSFSAQKWPTSVETKIVIIGPESGMPTNVSIMCTLSWESTQD